MTRKIASSTSAIWGLEPPISRERAGEEFGVQIPEDHWFQICAAYETHGQNMANLEVSKLNKNPNDPRSWFTRIGRAKKQVSDAIVALEGIDRAFLSEVIENYEAQSKGDPLLDDFHSKLGNFVKGLLDFSYVLHNVEPIVQEVPTEAKSRMDLVKQIFFILKPLGASLSNGWKVAQGQPSNASMTGFERLVELLEIHQGETPRATIKWIAGAVSRK